MTQKQRQLVFDRNHEDTGQMNKRAMFQESTDTSDGAGGITPSWVNKKSVWVKVEVRRGNQLTAFAGHSQSFDSLLFTTRYLALLDEIPPLNLRNYRIVYNSRAYKIKAGNRVNEEMYYLSFETEGNSWESV